MNSFSVHLLEWIASELILSLGLLLLYVAGSRFLKNASDRYLFLCATFFFLPFLPWVNVPVFSHPFPGLVAATPGRLTGGSGAASSPTLLSFLPSVLAGCYLFFLFARIARVCLSMRLAGQIWRSGEKLSDRSDWPVILHEYSIPPVPIGIFRPKILLSKALFESLSAGELRIVLDHEEAHIRRHDCAMGFLRVVIREVLFFSPFARVLAQKLEDEMELSIDAMILERANYPAKTYGQLLVALSEGLGCSDELEFGSPFLSKKLITRRLIAMKTSNQVRKRMVTSLLIVAFLSSSLVGLSASGLSGASRLEVTKLEFRIFPPAGEAPILTNKDFESAEMTKDATDRRVISLTLKPDAAERFEAFTEKNIGKKLGIFVDGKLINAPVIKQKIGSGRLLLSGDFSDQQARQMVKELSSGGKPPEYNLNEPIVR